MTRIRALAAAAVAAVMLAGCGGNPDPAAAPTTPATPSATTTTAAAPTSPAVPSPAASPSRKPTLPTQMTDDGGYCTSANRCGHYVAGTSCKGVEWCRKAHLVQPGTWSTDGGAGPTDCMWELSSPPEYGLTDGGYATGPLQVQVPAGALFSVNDCPAGWQWQGP